jgi:hypothetical protein
MDWAKMATADDAVAVDPDRGLNAIGSVAVEERHLHDLV